MTRKAVYVTTLVAFLAAAAMSLASIIIPRWISWDNETISGERIHYTYGLHRRCSSIDGRCDYFPQQEDCHHDRYFCSMWRSVGFLMSFAIVIEGMTLIAYLVILAGGVQKRATGWKILSSMLMLVGAVQLTSMSLMAFLYDNDDRFYPGWKLDDSWIMCTISGSVMVVIASIIIASAFTLPSEGGYELIPNYEEEE